MQSPRDIGRDLLDHSAALRRVARAVARDGAGADDLVQDTWVAALLAARAGDTSGSAIPRSLRAWLGTVARRLAAGRRARERHVALEGEPETQVAPFDSAACAEVAARLATAVERLPALDRDVVVRRYWHDEPPRAIADALGLDTQAVRNRLHRALARLRLDLGDRRALLGLAALGSPLRPPHVAALAALLPMKYAFAAALTAALALILWIPSRAPQRSDAPARPDVFDAAPPPDAPATLGAVSLPSAGQSGARVAAPPGATGTSALAAPTDGTEASQLKPGLLWLEVIDGLDGQRTFEFVLTVGPDPAPDGVRPRDIAGSDLKDAVALPVGRYRGALYGVGRDPVDVGVFSVFPDRVTNLGLWTLSLGSGAIEVAVAAPQGTPYRVELHGAGRRAGDCCAGSAPARCAVCGHRADRDEQAIVAPTPARFERLAAGPYTLVARNAEERIVATREVVLAHAETRYLELAPGTRDVEVWLVDGRDQPFDGIWREEDGEEYCAPIQLFGWAKDVLVAKGVVAPPEGGRALPEEPTTSPTVAPAAATPDAGAAARPFFATWPSAFGERPVVTRSEASVERLGPGRIALRRVPLELDGAQAQCGPYVTALSKVDPARGDVIVLRVSERCGARSRSIMEAGMKSCTDCHVVQEAVK